MFVVHPVSPLYPPIRDPGCIHVEQSMLRSARVASARPPAPSCPRSARALCSRPFASSHAAHASGDRGARTGSSAAGAAASAEQLQRSTKCTRAHTSLGHAALCLARTRRAGLGRPGSRSVPTASCAMRSVPLAQDLQRQHPSPVPPLQNAGVKWTQNGMGIRRRGPRRRLVI